LIEAIAHGLHYAPGTNRMPAASSRPFQTVAASRQHPICHAWCAARQTNPVLVLLGHDPYCARSTLETEMPTGTVKWFNPTKGYGFIQPSGGGGKDVFVHISAVERAGLRSLNEGQTIEYEIENNRGKDSAINLRVK